MWLVVVLAACVALLVACCWSLEMGLVLALAVAAWCALCGEGGGAAAAPDGSNRRAARAASNVDDRPGRKRRPIVREANVQRTPLPAVLTAHPSEGVLDDPLSEALRRRGCTADARHYHATALPNAIRAAARDLTTADPAIVPLDGFETCQRPLGET